jgi:hypothetical protein
MDAFFKKIDSALIYELQPLWEFIATYKVERPPPGFLDLLKSAHLLEPRTVYFDVMMQVISLTPLVSYVDVEDGTKYNVNLDNNIGQIVADDTIR